MKTKKTYSIDGMHCVSCSMLIEGELEDRGYVAACNFAKGTVVVESDDTDVSDEKVKEAVEAAGYRLTDG